MFRRCLITCFVATALIATAETASAAGPRTTVRTAPAPQAYTAAQREAIRQMPLLERPNRPGHFYGNTVRRLYYGRRAMGR